MGGWVGDLPTSLSVAAIISGHCHKHQPAVSWRRRGWMVERGEEEEEEEEEEERRRRGRMLKA